ncbi:MAG: ABC transporter ATP-binding protein [Anaerolineaceae bacterium]|nr:ABC transporter ATP-binding protein [Anaerolineaceae bacterium]
MAFLELTNITKRFVKFAAVEDFNLKVEKGEFVSFLGPSGCGKTTTLRMIAGFETATEGNIYIDGKDVVNRPPNQRNIGMVFQSYALFPNMTVADNIGFGLKVAKKSSEEIKARVDEMLNLIHMSDFRARYPYQMSGGQQQRVALARALAIQPQVLLLDEPLSALDAKIRVELRNEIRSIQRKLGITTVYVTHDQEEALSLSDRVVVMNSGHTEQIGTPFEIYNFPQTPFVASFVGTLNIIYVDVVDPANGILKLEEQEIATNKPVRKAKDDKVRIALRPEMVKLTTDDPAANELKVVVDSIVFLGAIVRMRVKVGTTKFSMDLFNNPDLQLPKEGSQISVFFSRDACMVLQD